MRARRADHSDHDPSARALAAMAEAAERSRLTGAGAEGNRSPSSFRSSRLRRWVVLSAGLVVAVAVVAVVVFSSAKGRGTSASTASSAPVPHSRPVTGSGSPTTHPPTGTSSTVPASTVPASTVPPPASSPATSPAASPAAVPTPTTSPTPSTSPPSGGPVLSSLEPSSGTAGQVLIVTGTDLLSPSGQITAQFGGETAVIACPMSTSCLMEVPASSGTSASASVTVTTDGGTSNPLTFTYG